MRSFENVEVIQTFVNWLLSIYIYIVNTILALLLVILVVSYIISLLINTESKLHGKFSIKNLKQHFKQWKQDIKERFTKDKVIEISKNRFLKVKPYVWKCRHIVVGYALFGLSWIFVSFFFGLVNKSNLTITSGCSDAENILLGKWGLYTLGFFIIAPMFITFSFGNKFVRNIGVLIYILGIIFFFLGVFLQLGCPAI